MHGILVLTFGFPPMRVIVDIPDEFYEQLVPSGREPGQLLLEESVAAACRDGRLTMEQARQLLGFATPAQMETFLQHHKVYEYTAADLEKDMATLHRLLAAQKR